MASLYLEEHIGGERFGIPVDVVFSRVRASSNKEASYHDNKGNNDEKEGRDNFAHQRRLEVMLGGRFGHFYRDVVKKRKKEMNRKWETNLSVSK